MHLPYAPGFAHLISGPINGAWHVVPVLEDGTAGEPRRFATPEQARAFAASEYPATCIGKQSHWQSHTKHPRVGLHIFPTKETSAEKPEEE